MEVLWCEGTDPIAFLLPPYTFHAVMSFECSAHAGVRLVGFDWFEDAKRLIDWEITWALNTSRNGSSIGSALSAMEYMLEELKSWSELVKEKKKYGIAAEVYRWQKDISRRVKGVIESLRRDV